MAFRAGLVFDAPVNGSVWFITGCDTGVGKTALTILLTRSLRVAGIPVAALKPVCSGSRRDARMLRAAASGVLTLDEVNPWHFRAPLAPLLAARAENKRLLLRQAVAHIRAVQKRFQTVLIEGAGGLRSPLGTDFDSGDLIAALGATPIVVCPNRLGAINQVLLVLAALPAAPAARAQIVLSAARGTDHASSSNLVFLRRTLGATRVHVFPRLRPGQQVALAPLPGSAPQPLRHLTRALYLPAATRAGAKETTAPTHE